MAEEVAGLRKKELHDEDRPLEMDLDEELVEVEDVERFTDLEMDTDEVEEAEGGKDAAI